jgi:signal peptidase I
MIGEIGRPGSSPPPGLWVSDEVRVLPSRVDGLAGLGAVDPRPAAAMSGIRSDLLRAALALLIAFSVTTVAVSLAFSRGLVIGDFMAPALLDGDAIVVDRVSGRFLDYRPGEIVSLQIPGEPQGRVLKRVVGGPGDPVLASGTLLRPLGPDEFVVDDDLALNGRTVLERGEIEGRVLLRAWPPSRFKWRPGFEP